MDLIEKIQQLLSGFIFLMPFQRDSLIKSLPKFSQDELKRMYINFSKLKEKEDSLIEKFFAKNPSLHKNAESLISGLASEIEAGETVKGETQFMEQAEKLLKDFNK